MVNREGVWYNPFTWTHRSSGINSIPPACSAELVEAISRKRSGDPYYMQDTAGVSRGSVGICNGDQE